MHAPVDMLMGAGNGKAIAVIAVLIGLFAVASMQQAKTQQAGIPGR